MNTNTINPTTTQPRRWFRFRLRTLLILVTLLSAVLGWVGWELDQRRKEKPAIAWVEEMGGEVIFYSSFPNGDERSWWARTKDKWLGETAGFVGLSGTHINDLSPLSGLMSLDTLYLSDTEVSDLSPLAELKNLRGLGLSDTKVSDLSPLAELTSLEYLGLSDTQVSDLSHLAELNKLKELDLTNIKVSEELVEELRLALPNCEIDFESTD